MDLNKILETINSIFRSVLDDSTLEIFSSTTAEDVEDWDSLSHIQLVVAIEEQFKIRFSSSEIENFANVGEMCNAILKKIED